jgi:hypothetical protein
VPGHKVIAMTDLDTLRAAVSGPVLTPADAGYADEVLGFNLAFRNTPEVVVGAATVADVQAAVRYAAEHGLHVTVLATGHGAHGPITDGLVITTRRLDSVSVDPGTRIATVGGGARWGAVVEAAAPFGLAPITGSSTNVGVTGYLLGGGLGPLSRSHGFSSDYVRGFSIVTADGEVLQADGERNADLFWALRGGKGGFGVVVETRVELVELATLYGGTLIFAAPDIETVLRGWVDWSVGAADEVTTSVAIVHFPPIEQVPEPMRGQDLLMLRFAYPGDPAEGERLAAPLVALATPVMGAIGPMPAAAIGMIHNDPTDPAPAWSSGALLEPIDQDFVTALLAHVGAGVRTPLMATEVRQLGGATRRDVADGSAVGGRGGAYTFNVVGAPDPSLFETVIPAAFDALTADLARWVAAETTINFSVWHSPDAYRRAWPAETLQRLDALRAELDPNGVFAYGPQVE